MVFRIFILAILLVMSFNSSAANSEGTFTVLAHGTHSCGKFVEAVNEGQTQENWIKWNGYLAYTYGYFTGVNAYRSDTRNIKGSTDQAGFMGYIEKYCRENPLSDYFDAVESVEIQLYKNRAK